MHIDSIQTGIVIDHITAGKGMELYRLLHLDRLDCSVAILMNVPSSKMGQKDIIKINQDIEIDMNAIGFVDPGATIVIIRDSQVVEKRTVELPKKLTNVLHCKNPRCITTTEQELPHVFLLTEPAKKVYRCMYCETKANI